MTMGLSGTLRKHRKRMRLTQQEVANRIGVQRSTYSRYEEGTNRPSWKALLKLADLYEISMDELVGRESQEGTKEAAEKEASSQGVPGRSPGERNDNAGGREGNHESDSVEQEQIQRVLALFWNASRYARETALLILENGQKGKTID